MVPRIQGRFMPTVVDTLLDLEEQEGALREVRGWSGRSQDSTCNSYPGPLFRSQWRFPRQRHQAPSHSDPETLLKGAKGCSYPALRAGLLPFPPGLGTFIAMHGSLTSGFGER